MTDYKLDDEIKSEETVFQHQQKVLASDSKRRMNVNVENQFEIYEKITELEKKRTIKNLEQNYCQKEDDEVIEKNGYVGWKNAKGITPYDINPELLKNHPSDDKS